MRTCLAVRPEILRSGSGSLHQCSLRCGSCFAIPTSPVVKRPLQGQIRAVPRYVYAFDEPCDGGRELLGGKGIGPGGDDALGVPVPAGFTITTEACRAYMEAKQLPDGLEQEVGKQVREARGTTGKRFGDPSDPLLVSVRSGAAVSMPGMMDTILNVGLTTRRRRGSRPQPATRASR